MAIRGANDKISDEDFERELVDLPRGTRPPERMRGRERGLTAYWNEADDIRRGTYEKPDGILVGRRKGTVIGYRDNRHMLTVAGSRGGKGVSLIIPNLLHYEGSALVIDPKGENAAVTAGRRGQGADKGKGEGLGQDVYVLDPFGESGIPTSHYNPLDVLKADSDVLVEDVGIFADALIVPPERGDKHWAETAQSLLMAIILMVVIDPRFEGRRNLVTVRALLMGYDKAIRDLTGKNDEPEEEADAAETAVEGEGEGEAEPEEDSADKMSGEEALFRIMMAQEGHSKHDYLCVGVATQFLRMDKRERSGVISEATTQTRWLDGDLIRAVLSAESDFNIEDLKTKPTTIYLCLPATRMPTHFRWLRLMILLSFMMMERTKDGPPREVLFVLDEFAVLGHMQAIEMAAGLMAGFGVKLWPILQNIGQLRRHYAQTWQTFVANSGIVTAFSVSDDETLKALSSFLGDTAIIEQRDSGVSSSALMRGGSAVHDHPTTLSLLAPHELRLILARENQRALVLHVSDRPALVKRFVYYDDDPYFRDKHGRPLFDPDPKYMKIK